MTFVSFEFVIFALIVIPTYFLLPQRWRWVWALVASYVFYAAWNAAYLILILFSTLVDYFVGLALGRVPSERKRRRLGLLLLSIFVNLGVLFTFKYFNFFSASLADLLSSLGIQTDIRTLDVLLPVGISFYTFQSMAYTIDVFRQKTPVERHLGYFALYVSFFPQLVAGPIERAQNILPQLRVVAHFDADRVNSGLRLVLWGFFQKVVIADRLAVYTNAVYNDVEQFTGVPLILATVFFTIQIYCDFAGYSNIAIGVARIMGIQLMQNFRQPYFATSVREYWARWHISLSTWFRDYVYIPLGGNRVPYLRNLLNLLIVFVVSGLWHGAAWTFVIWGFLHGVYIVAESVWSKLTDDNPRLHIPNVVQHMLTLAAVMFGFIIFRANSMDDAGYVIRNLFNFSGDQSIYQGFTEVALRPQTEFILAMVVIGILFLGDWVEARIGFDDFMKHRRLPLRWGLYYTLLFVLGFTLIFQSASEAFIYFQF